MEIKRENINKITMNCSKEGKKYELLIYNIVKNCKFSGALNGVFFNTQRESELGGCSAKNDIECNFAREKDISIEIKKQTSPDWSQCALKHDGSKWVASTRGKFPNRGNIFINILSNKPLFNGNMPPFLVGGARLTHTEWLEIKKNTPDFDDIYLDCPNYVIKQLYKEKGCQYIQVSEKGLYHLGEDICKFNVPEFLCEQQLRIRVKVHKRKNTKGFCNLSVMVSCLPKNIADLVKSPYSLDNVNLLPENLTFY